MNDNSDRMVKMNESKTPEQKITCACPRGHKLRGGPEMIGRQVRCPRCRDVFSFGYAIRESVSDTAVLRLLGDAPAPPPEPKSAVRARPCNKCGHAISPEATVCQHCKFYVGQLDTFFQQLHRSKPNPN